MAQAAVEDLVLHEDDRSLVLPVVGLARLAFEALVEQHPPREGDEFPWNQDTLPAALIAACTELSAVEAERLWQFGLDDQAHEVFETCLRLSSPRRWTWASWRLDRDDRLAMELGVCQQLGIPHSHFLGGPPVWTERDRDLALAYLEHSRDRCPGGCGVPSDARQDPGAFEVVQESCIWCEQLSIARNAVPESERDRIHTYLRRVRAAD